MLDEAYEFPRELGIPKLLYNDDGKPDDVRL